MLLNNTCKGLFNNFIWFVRPFRQPANRHGLAVESPRSLRGRASFNPWLSTRGFRRIPAIPPHTVIHAVALQDVRRDGGNRSQEGKARGQTVEHGPVHCFVAGGCGSPRTVRGDCRSRRSGPPPADHRSSGCCKRIRRALFMRFRISGVGISTESPVSAVPGCWRCC